MPIEILELQTSVLSSLGHLMVQEPSFMLLEMTKALYDGVLTSDNDKLRCVVLQNFDNYLREEDKKLSDLESNITKNAKSNSPFKPLNKKDEKGGTEGEGAQGRVFNLKILKWLNRF